MTPPATAPAANNLEAFWMPFTANRQFKSNPRLLATRQGHALLDAGGPQDPRRHGGPVVRQRRPRPRGDQRRRSPSSSSEMDYAPPFQMGHPKAFELADAPCRASLPGGLDHVFLLQLRLRGRRHRAQDRARLSPRARRGHAHPPDRPRARLPRRRLRRHLGRRHGQQPQDGSARMLPGVDHLPHTHDLPQNAFSRGQPEHGAELADELERLVRPARRLDHRRRDRRALRRLDRLLLPPKGYLQRLREICDKHGILLIFDEVITGFGRLGTGFAADKFGVIPDLMTVAKGITNGTVPMGGVFVRKHDLRRLHERAGERDRAVPRLHLLGPSAGLRGGLGRARHLQATRACSSARPSSRQYWEDGVHSLKGLPERHRHPQPRPGRRHRPGSRMAGAPARAASTPSSRPSSSA